MSKPSPPLSLSASCAAYEDIHALAAVQGIVAVAAVEHVHVIRVIGPIEHIVAAQPVQHPSAGKHVIPFGALFIVEVSALNNPQLD